jgi:hypothetical protein
VGWITFAGIVMIISGGFSILQGLGMLINSNQFPNSDSVFSQNATTWGWVQLCRRRVKTDPLSTAEN